MGAPGEARPCCSRAPKREAVQLDELVGALNALPFVPKIAPTPRRVGTCATPGRWPGALTFAGAPRMVNVGT